MQMTYEAIMDDVLGLLRKVADDWEYTGEITPQTRFFADMGLASLDVVVLGTAIQEYYGQVFPFVQFFTEIGQRDIPDIPVGEWIGFIHRQLNHIAEGNGRPEGMRV